MPESVGRIHALVTAFQADAVIEQITFLPQGVSNENYRVDTEQGTWLVKLYGRQVPDAAIDAQRTLAQLGVCPAPVYVDKGHRCAIFAYAPGQMPSDFDGEQALLRLTQIHALPSSGAALDLHDELAGYASEPYYHPYAQALQEVVALTQATSEDYCFCHNDLIKENIISHRGQWQCIDFEYAQHGDRYFDLAMLTLSFKLSVEQQEWLFSQYFSALELQGNWQKFKAMQKLVAALNYFWYARHQVQHRIDDAKLSLDTLLA
ncbi:phosphotransferase [Pseudoalteromonas sp. T1lg88]|uniref:phosphotransferase n=1 Tax=Pseudoalteromonas sp. T1lg88 TaxID=2077104 RepID=UPI000CF73A8A|nr:phosphotransferase [Pseudoalteromonas sp. T1lg88]